MEEKRFSYLALGDSYTIGESIPLVESFPYQTVNLLRKDGFHVHAPEIIAKTGWTTDELASAMESFQLLPSYHFVSLLIGVNNQYRGKSIENYQKEFEELVLQAIKLGGNNPKNVVVLSIPDWGITPFAKDRDFLKIASEIDAFNKVNKEISTKHSTHYINITNWTREAALNSAYLAVDGLHPSSLEYQRWATVISEFVKNKITDNQ